MRKSGEITVFLSLILVCVMSLLLGLVESARTAGARLYLELASHSAMASVMSQYNRNLWDMYHLLFLEAESDLAVEESYGSYLNTYLEQENWFPMKLEDVSVTEKTTMTEAEGLALEQEILSYVGYRLPEVAGNLAGIAEMAGEAEKAGDFRYLFEVCRSAGQKTRKLEASRGKVERLLEEIHEQNERLEQALEKGEEDQIEDEEEALEELIQEFPRRVQAYEREVQKVSGYLEELKAEQGTGVEDAEAGNHLAQEIAAYEGVAAEAGQQLERYRNMETMLEHGEIPEMPGKPSVDAEKVFALERLEALFQKELLDLVLPADAEVSSRSVSLNGIPSDSVEESSFWDRLFGETGRSEQALQKNGSGFKELTIAEQFLVNEYVILCFDSFIKPCERKLEPARQALSYEQEYLLCGQNSDRKNLSETVERLLLLRGAMNLLYLLGSGERKMEADGLAAVVSGGNAPVQFVLSFFIMTLWAFGEAVWDVKHLLVGNSVPFWKHDGSFRLSLEDLLAFRFLDPVSAVRDQEPHRGEADVPSSEPEAGNSYEDYMRILLLLMDKPERNYRMMDVIQWNLRSVQSDFSVADCLSRVKMQVNVQERHLFLLQTEYRRTVEAVGVY